MTSTEPPHAADADAALLALYDDGVADVYRYLLRRCRNRSEAEDLTSDVFVAATEAVRRQPPPELSVAWLIGVARHKLVDHWRRDERERRRLQAVADDAGTGTATDPWDVELDVLLARDVLDRLGAHHRSALTLRYLDRLPVPEVATILDRTVHATEALLVRARRAFRTIYEPASQSSPPGSLDTALPDAESEVQW